MSPHMPGKWMFALLASACSVLGQTPPPGGARTLDVIVLDQSHLPVPGAEVEIALGDQSLATVFSDQSGRTVFPPGKPGRYTIRVSKAGRQHKQLHRDRFRQVERLGRDLGEYGLGDQIPRRRLAERRCRLRNPAPNRCR